MLNKLIVGILQYLPKDFIRIFSARYIAGDELKDAVKVTKKLNNQHIKATMDLLGEFLTRAEKIEYYKQEYIRLFEESVKTNLDNSFSVKPTMFGLLIDQDMCYNNLRELASKASSYGRFIRIDMEDSQCTDMEIDLYKRLLNEFPNHVGLVLQAYLKRTLSDLKDLIAFDNGRGLINIRICKGIYNESAQIAYKNKEEINQHYLEDLHFMFANNIYPAIATHDKKLIMGTYDLINQMGISPDRFEFQMLYGVTPDLRKSIVNKGYTMRVYVPYGKEWLNYSIRRLKENPRMITHMIKALLLRG
jgi:proline dehydrogenase